MRALALSVLIVMSGSTAMAEPRPTRQLEDREAPTARPLPAPPVVAQARPVDVQAVPVLVPCDEPSAACSPALPAPMLVPAPAKPPWQLRVSVSLTSGVVAAANLMGGELGPAAYIGGDIRLLWSRLGKRWGLGLRFSGSKSLAIRTGHNYGEGGAAREGEASGADVGFLLDVYGFWFSTGLGVAFYSGGSDVSYLPEGFLALGYDIPLHRYLALRLSASVSTLIVTARAQAGAGLVVRF